MSAAALDRSKIGRTSRARGHRCELTVAHYLRSVGFVDACTTREKLGRSGSKTPGDVDFHALVTLEVKDRDNSRWPTWCRQAAAEAPLGTVPVVVRRTRGVVDVGAWPIRARWTDWLTIFDTLPGRPGSDPVAEGVEVDGEPWLCASMADLVAAVRAVDGDPR